MSKVDRNNPKRAIGSDSTYSLMDFMAEFPNDAACLDWLWRNRYSDDGSHARCPKCAKQRKFHRVKSRPSYSCDTCGHHIHPTAGTIMHRSATSLHLWFYAMYLMTSTRCAVSAKHLERELGVTYKTAWRMANLIRNVLMDQDDDDKLSGEVEVDETFIGGKPRAADRYRAYRLARHPAQRGAFARATFTRTRLAKVIPDSSAGREHDGLAAPRHPGQLPLRVEGFFANLKGGSTTRIASTSGRRTWRARAGAQVATGLPQRVRVAVQPPQGLHADVPHADLPRGGHGPCA